MSPDLQSFIGFFSFGIMIRKCIVRRRDLCNYNYIVTFLFLKRDVFGSDDVKKGRRKSLSSCRRPKVGLSFWFELPPKLTLGVFGRDEELVKLVA